jgi:putative sigma-54 modulation protein
MEIQYISKGVEITDAIKNFAQKKLQKITRLDEIVDVTMVLTKEKYRYVTDLIIRTKKNVLNIKEESNDIKVSIQQAVSKAHNQMRKQRDKVVNRKRRVKSEYTPWAIGVLSESTESITPRIVRENIYDIKLMSIENALEQIQALNKEFLIFRDSEDNKISIIYKRKDGNYGLITPEID